MSPENPVPREGWGRRKGERDPVTGEPVSPVDAILRIEKLEGKVRRNQIENWVLYGAAFLVLAAGGFVYSQTQSETEARVDQTCTIFERAQRNDVRRVTQTFLYLDGLTRRQLASPINRAVLAQLPTTIREAVTDDAPDYCDKPGIGLREPDATAPPCPDSLRARVKACAQLEPRP